MVKINHSLKVNKKGPVFRPAPKKALMRVLLAAAKQLKQHHEHVDEVQVKAQSAHNG